MNKKAFIGDPHFGRKSEHPSIRKAIKDGQKAFFVKLVSDLKLREIKDIYFTGDIFDTRNSINVEALIETRRLMKDLLSDFNIYIVLGNHDMYFENSYDICSIEILEDLPNVTVYRTSIQSIPNFNGTNKTLHIIPWVIPDHIPAFVEYLNIIKSNRENNILFGHFEMMGVDMEGGNMSTFGLSPNMFAEASNLIISGHYHGMSKTVIDGSAVQYLGSPYPLTFANSDSKHGYWIFDGIEMEFIENTISPSFTTIMDTDDLTSIGDLSNTFVRLYFNNAKSKEEIFQIRTLIESKKPLLLNSIPYKNGSIETNKTEAQRQANKLLNMDLMSLSEIYIDNNSDSLPSLRTYTNPKLEILTRIKGYNEKLTFKK